MAAGTALVLAAIQNIAGSGVTARTIVAAVFGFAAGVALGADVYDVLPLAGSYFAAGSDGVPRRLPSLAARGCSHCCSPCSAFRSRWPAPTWLTMAALSAIPAHEAAHAALDAGARLAGQDGELAGPLTQRLVAQWPVLSLVSHPAGARDHLPSGDVLAVRWPPGIMNQHAVITPGQTPLGRSSGGERFRVLALAAGVLLLIAVYFGLRSSVTETGTVLPFQMLARDLVSADQAMFKALKESLLDAEGMRASTGHWPEAAALAGLPRVPLGGDVASTSEVFSWREQTRGVITHYLGLPAQDGSAPAWMIAIREPEPGVPTDTAPNDEEHHRLPDGTVLHVSIWTHRFGGQVDPAFVPQPEAAGWTQILVAPLNPLAQPFAPLTPK